MYVEVPKIVAKIRSDFIHPPVMVHSYISIYVSNHTRKITIHVRTSLYCYGNPYQYGVFCQHYMSIVKYWVPYWYV